MSKRYTPHFGADPSTNVRVLCLPGNEKAYWANTLLANIPSGKAGYEPGCMLQVTNGTLGRNLYINVGTAASCTFQLVPTTTDALALAATALELNRIADRDNRVVACTAATLVVTEAEHNDKTITLDRAAGIAVTLPAAAPGLRFRFIVLTTFSGAATIKSVSGADVMIGGALMGNNSDNTVVEWPAIAASTYDTIDMLGTGNSTGGMAGQEIVIEGMAANVWYVRIRGDAAGSEATPFADSVA